MFDSTIIKNRSALVGSLAIACLASVAGAQNLDSLLDHSRANVIYGPPTETADRGACTSHINQPPNQTNGIFSDSACAHCGSGQQVLAENFVVTSGITICEITCLGGYFPSDTAITDTFTVLVHADDGAGLPGAVLYSETGVASTRATTGVILFGVSEYAYVLTLAAPVALSAGTYHLEMYNDTTASPGDSWFWEVGDLDATTGILGQAWTTVAPGSGWNYDGGTDMAFGITVGAGTSPGAEYCAETTYNCPCFVTSAPGEGCPNTTGVGATLVGSGNPTIGSSTFALTSAGLPDTVGLFVQGTSALGGVDGNQVGEGRLCLGPQKRYQPQQIAGGTVSRSNFDNFAAVGQSMNYQFWYRDPANVCNGGGFNFSPAWNVLWN